MRTGKFSKSQIVAILKQQEAGVTVADNGPELVGKSLTAWAKQHGVELMSVRRRGRITIGVRSREFREKD